MQFRQYLFNVLNRLSMKNFSLFFIPAFAKHRVGSLPRTSRASKPACPPKGRQAGAKLFRQRTNPSFGGVAETREQMDALLKLAGMTQIPLYKT